MTTSLFTGAYFDEIKNAKLYKRATFHLYTCSLSTEHANVISSSHDNMLNTTKDTLNIELCGLFFLIKQDLFKVAEFKLEV